MNWQNWRACLTRCLVGWRPYLSSNSSLLPTPAMNCARRRRSLARKQAALCAPRRRMPEEYGQALGTIQAEGEYMARLVSDLLTLARCDAGPAETCQN